MTKKEIQLYRNITLISIVQGVSNVILQWDAKHVLFRRYYTFISKYSYFENLFLSVLVFLCLAVMESDSISDTITEDKWLRFCVGGVSFWLASEQDKTIHEGEE